MSYRIAGIDVHKKLLAVVVSGVEIESEYQFEQRWFGSNPEQLRSINHAASVLVVSSCLSMLVELVSVARVVNPTSNCFRIESMFVSSAG